MIHVYTVRNLIHNLISLSFGSQLRNGCKYKIQSRLVIGTSRTVGSAKKFVRITSGFGGREFTKTLRKVCTYQKLKFSFLLLEYCKIRECYAVANAITAETCIVYCCI